MIPELVLTLLGGAGIASGWIAYALASRSLGRRDVKVGDLSRDLAQAIAEREASNGQRKRLSLQVAADLRTIRELRARLEEMAHLLPRDSLDVIRGMLDRVLSPADDDDSGTSALPGVTPGTIDQPDPPGPVPDWID